ncbi:hypothetical protein CRYUN_Cryun04dG0022100 [Craigia yunnanensis]
MATSSFLHNRYWILRHGKSIPNEKGLIVSSLENGILLEYRLASEGVEQAQLAGKLFLKYPEIWAMDEKDPFMRPEGGESVDDVASRLSSAMTTMESEYQGCAILVVSHGDPLQILQTILSAASEQVVSSCSDLALKIQAVRIPSILSQHRKFALLTGELRTVL